MLHAIERATRSADRDNDVARRSMMYAKRVAKFKERIAASSDK